MEEQDSVLSSPRLSSEEEDGHHLMSTSANSEMRLVTKSRRKRPFTDLTSFVKSNANSA